MERARLLVHARVSQRRRPTQGPRTERIRQQRRDGDIHTVGHRQTDGRTDERERETEGAINARAKERDEHINLLCDKDKYIKEELKLDRVRE